MTRRDIAVLACLAVAVAAAGAPLLAGRTLYYGDITLQFVPWRTFARQALLTGVLPLWIPDVFCGMPFLANGQSAVLYPYHWLSLPLRPADTIALGCLLHVFLAAAGAYAYTRSVGRSRSASCLAALAFGLGGFVLTKQQFPSLAYTLAWLGWLGWAQERLRRRPGPAAAAVLAGVVAFQWLAGHAQMAFLQLVLMGLSFHLARRETRRGKLCAWWLAGLALGTLLAAAQLLPTYELLGASDRGEFDFADAARFNLPPWQLGTLLLPELFGSPMGRLPYLGVGPYWEMSAWVGLVALAFALAGARGERFWAITAVAGLVLAWGRYTPLYGVLWAVLPPLQVGRDPARFALYTTFALGQLAAAGWDRESDAAERWFYVFTVGLALLTVAAALCPEAGWEGLLRLLQPAALTKKLAGVPGLAAAWRTGVAAQAFGALLFTAAAALIAGRPRPSRRWLLLLAALELLWHGAGVNPTVPAAAFDVDPRPSHVREAVGPIYVSEQELKRISRNCFNYAHYPRRGMNSATLAQARAALVPNVTVGTGTWQFGGYDPLRPAAMGRWLAGLEKKPSEKRDEVLPMWRASGRLEAGVWYDYAPLWPDFAAPVVRQSRPTAQRRVFHEVPAAGFVEELTAMPAGWHGCDARLAKVWEGVHVAWEVRRPNARLYYAPASFSVGLFLSLLGVACVAAVAVTECSSGRSQRG
ncbi:MAG: hypothetical protein HYU66_21135 [Armatimonadetes bacterium]|nr:hypothetical protein [Armatimonadota bacterium]